MRPTLLCALLLGCTPAPITTDASLAPDAGPPHTDSGAEDSGPPIDAPTDDAPADAGNPDARGPDAGPPPSTEFVELYDTVLVPHCGGEHCHAPGTNSSTYFADMTPALQMPDPASARAALIDRPFECAWSADDRVRVVPFDPASSGLMQVGIDGICGSRHYLVIPDFGDEELAAIESWIAGGAL